MCLFASFAGSTIYLFIYFSVSGVSLHPNWLIDHPALIGQVHQIPTLLHLLKEKWNKQNAIFCKLRVQKKAKVVNLTSFQG